MTTPAKGDYVHIDNKAGKVVGSDGGKLQVEMADGGAKVWRPLAECTPMFTGNPKKVPEIGDFCKLGDEYGNVVGLGGGRVQVELIGGKKLWRGFGDVVVEDEGREPGNHPKQHRITAAPKSATKGVVEEADKKPSESESFNKKGKKPNYGKTVLHAPKLEELHEAHDAAAPAPAVSSAEDAEAVPESTVKKVAVTFRLPFKREAVFAALVSPDEPLGFDTSSDSFSHEVFWNGTDSPDGADQLLVGCIRKSEYSGPFSGTTLSTLVELEAPRRVKWQQKSASGAFTFGGSEGQPPTTTIVLETFGQGCIVDLELAFDTVAVPRWLCCLGCCAAPMMKLVLSSNLSQQWRDGMLRRGHKTVVDQAAARVQAVQRGNQARKEGTRIPRKAAIAFLGAMLDKLEGKVAAGGKGKGLPAGVKAKKGSRATDKKEEDAIKAKAKAAAARPTKQQQQQLASEAADKQKVVKKGFVVKGSSAAAAPTAAPVASLNRSVATLPKAHLHLHFRQSGRQSTLRELTQDFNASVKAKAAKFNFAPDAPAEVVVPDGASDDEAEWMRGIIAARGDYDRAVEAHAKSGDAKSERKVKKTRQKYVALFEGLTWPELDESPRAIERAPMSFAGFTAITAMQQSVVGNHPAGEGAAFRRLLLELCEDAQLEGIRWFELSISLEARRHKWLGICDALDEAAARFPHVGVGLVLCISRGEPVAKVEATLDTVLHWCAADGELIAKGLQRKIVAMGLVGNESGDPRASKFAACFEKAKAVGWPPVPHAGEMTGDGGPDAILDAIDVGAKRIGHGFLCVTVDSERAKEAAAKMAELQVCCEVCPVSNIHLCDKCFGGAKAFEFARHPLPKMLEAGIPCCLNGDDPATFGAATSHGLVREFEVCRDLMGLSDGQLAQCARNSFVHSFCPPHIREQALVDIAAWEGKPATVIS